MRTQIEQVRSVVVPHLHQNRGLAVLAVLAVILSVGLWWWNGQVHTHHISLASGVELKYRKDLIQILCSEAERRDLQIDIQSGYRAADSIAKVASGELDAAVVPAGMSLQEEKVRQVAVFDCEPLQLFVRPEIASAGLAGLRGKRLNLGSVGSGSRALAADVLQFAGLKAGEDYQDESYAYADLIKLPPEEMPDGVFSLSPLPSPLGERLAQQYGYQLLELPFGAALGLRKRTIEEVYVPAHTYRARPAVPDKPLQTIGTRALLVANAAVPAETIRRLLEVLCESDFSRRAGMPALDEKLVLRSVEYPNHAGTIAYLHRHDPWINKDFVDNLMSLRGLFVSAASAIILVWQWYRRRKSAVLNDYLRVCTALEVEALRSSLQGEFDTALLDAALQRLTELRLDALARDQAGAFAGDQQFAMLLARIDNLQQSLPRLLSPSSRPSPVTNRKAA